MEDSLGQWRINSGGWNMLWIKDCWADLGCCRGGSGTSRILSGGLLYNAYQTKLATLNYTKLLSDTQTERQGEREGAVCSPIKDQILCVCLLTQQVWSRLGLWLLHHLVSWLLGSLITSLQHNYSSGSGYCVYNLNALLICGFTQ